MASQQAPRNRHARLPHLFSHLIPTPSPSPTDKSFPATGSPTASLTSNPTQYTIDQEAYSRALHAHTASQLPSPASAPRTPTLPNYSRTMHAFTLNQLNTMDNTGSHREASRRASESAGSSSASAASKQAAFRRATLAAVPPNLKPLRQLVQDERPVGPANTPELLLAVPVALGVAETDGLMMAAEEMRAEERELVGRLEAWFEELRQVGGVQSGLEGTTSEVRDFADVRLV